MQQRKSWKPILALIGARPSLSLSTYFDHISRLIFDFMVIMAVVLVVITEVMVCIVVIQHPFKVILPWLQQYGMAFLYMVTFTFAASLVVYLETKQEIKHLKGLITLSRADPDRPLPISLDEYLRVSMPPWLKSLPPVDLPDDMLETLQKEINPEEPWMKNLAAYLRQFAPEHSPSISILVSVGDSITISVLGSNGKCEEIPITHRQTAAIIGYLALQEKGAWVQRQEVVEPMYGDNDENLTQNNKRLNDALNKAAQKVLAQPGNRASKQPTSALENKLKLIEIDKSRKENRWRLLITCNVEIFPEVTSLYEQIMAAKMDPKIPPPKRDMLNRDCREIIKQYGKGLFASYQKKYRNQYQYWPWAREYYIEYQDKCLAVLEYAAQYEWAYAMKHRDKPDVLHTAIRQTAQLYAWKLQVALGVIPNLLLAEQALCMCLKRYKMIDYLAAAQDAYRIYATYMIERNDARKNKEDKTWEPPAKIIEIWPEATTLPDEDSES